MPLEEYAAGLIADYQRWRDERWLGEDWFICPNFITDIGAKQLPALEFLSAWLADGRKNELVILVEPGTGKTRLSLTGW